MINTEACIIWTRNRSRHVFIGISESGEPARVRGMAWCSSFYSSSRNSHIVSCLRHYNVCFYQPSQITRRGSAFLAVSWLIRITPFDRVMGYFQISESMLILMLKKFSCINGVISDGGVFISRFVAGMVVHTGRCKSFVILLQFAYVITKLDWCPRRCQMCGYHRLWTDNTCRFLRFCSGTLLNGRSRLVFIYKFEPQFCRR